MGQEYAIEVRDVYKSFKVYYDKSNQLREKVLFHNRNRFEVREILKGVSFQVKKGEAIGLIGKNGCGKSTTLKMLTRILKPNSGTIKMNGRVSSLIELGAGFHPDMTGRENIYINASIFGIKKKEVDERLERIIRFSELEEFIDNPVRTYSSGMYMRLAFSVAINVDADILLIDEILAVGDRAFQEKCFNKLKTLKDEGTTIVIVSHSLDQIQKICDRCIWIEKGLIKQEGLTKKICKEYIASMDKARHERARAETLKVLESKLDTSSLSEEEKKRSEKEALNASCWSVAIQCSADAHREGDGKVRYTRVRMLNEKGEETTEFEFGEKIIIEMDYQRYCDEKLPISFIIGVTRNDWVYCYGSASHYTNGEYLIAQKEGKVRLELEKNSLADGKYFLDVRIKNEQDEAHDNIFSLIAFTIKTSKKYGWGITAMKNQWLVEK